MQQAKGFIYKNTNYTKYETILLYKELFESLFGWKINYVHIQKENFNIRGIFVVCRKIKF